MTIDSNLFYLIIVVSVVHSVLVIVLDLLYLRSIRKLQSLKKEMLQMSDMANRDAAKILDQARQQERNLILEATHTASRVMSETKLFTKASEDAFRDSLQKATGLYEEQFKASLVQMQHDIEKVLKQTTVEMKKPLVAQLDSFTTTFQKELSILRQETKAQVEGLQRQTLDEVGKYKEQKLKEIETVIFALSRDLAREILGSEINPEKHEELVIKALEEAKKQKVF